MKTVFFLLFLFVTHLSADPKLSLTGSITFEVDTRFGMAKGKFDPPNFEEFNPESGKAVISILTKSIDTGNGMRDKHLRTDDFFDSEKFPKAVLTITSADAGSVKATLQIKDIKKELTIPYSKKEEGEKIIYSGNFTLNRKEFKMVYDSIINPIKDEVKVYFIIQSDKKG